MVVVVVVSETVRNEKIFDLAIVEVYLLRLVVKLSGVSSVLHNNLVESSVSTTTNKHRANYAYILCTDMVWYYTDLQS